MIFDFFPQDWNAHVKLDSLWKTNIQTSPYTGQEERCGLQERPARSQEILWKGMNRDEGQRLALAIMRAGTTEIGVPIYCDQAITTSSSSGTTINCPTTYRRFFETFAFVIYNVRTGTWEEGTIASLTSTTITPNVALGTTYPKGSLVFPIIKCMPLLDQKLPFITNHHGQAQVTFLEVTDENALPSSIGREPPAGVELVTVNGQEFPIFPGEVHWETVELGMFRPGTRYDQGRGTLTQLEGVRPLWTMAFEVLALTRAQAWQMVQFFDWVKGTLSPFWVICPVELLKAVTFDEDWVEVRQVGNGQDIEDFCGTVVVTMEDGSREFARVDEVTDSGDAWRIVYESPMDISAVPVRVDAAFLMRNDQDHQEEDWITDKHCRFRASFRELVSLDEDVEMPTEEV